MKRWVLVKLKKDGHLLHLFDAREEQAVEIAAWLNTNLTLTEDGLYYAVEIEDE